MRNLFYKIIAVFAAIIIGLGVYYLTTQMMKFSYFYFFKPVVEETVREMVKPDALRN